MAAWAARATAAGRTSWTWAAVPEISPRGWRTAGRTPTSRASTARPTWSSARSGTTPATGCTSRWATSASGRRTRPVDVLISQRDAAVGAGPPRPPWTAGRLCRARRVVRLPGAWQLRGADAHRARRGAERHRGGDRCSADLDLPRPAVEEPVTYVERLTDARLCSRRVGDDLPAGARPVADAVLEWMKGTGLRPVLSALDEEQQAEFVAEYAERLRAAYPQESFGTVLPVPPNLRRGPDAPARTLVSEVARVGTRTVPSDTAGLFGAWADGR